MIVNAIRGDSPKRTHNRQPVNERMPPGGNVKPIGNGGRVSPFPPAQPGPGQRSNLGEGPPPPKSPARPDPTDAAAEVWALVERAQAGDSEAFGLIYDRYVDTVFRFVYFRVGNRQLAEDLT